MAFRVSQRPANFLSIGDEKVDVGITAHPYGILVRNLGKYELRKTHEMLAFEIVQQLQEYLQFLAGGNEYFNIGRIEVKTSRASSSWKE